MGDEGPGGKDVCVNHSAMSDSVTPRGFNLPGSSSMGFSRQEDWSSLLFLSPGDLPNTRIEPRSPALQADSLPAELPRKPRESGELMKMLSKCC